MHRAYFSQISQKYIVAISGTILHLFVFVHMLGNLLIFFGAEAYNGYSHKLTSNPLILLFEIILALSFFSHVGLSSKIFIKNLKSRPKSYKVQSFGSKGTSLIHRTLWYQGVIIFIFIVLHLMAFKFGPHYDFTLKGERVRDFYRLVFEAFKNPYVVIWYLVAQFILGFHIRHGAYAIFQTLGFYNEKWLYRIKRICTFYAILIVLGFSALPLYIYFFK